MSDGASAASLECLAHRQLDPASIRFRRGHAVGVGGCADAKQLDFGFFALHQEYRGAFAYGGSIAIAAERIADALGQDREGVKSVDGQSTQAVRPADDNGVGQPGAQEPPSRGQRDRARTAGRRDRVGQSIHLEIPRQKLAGAAHLLLADVEIGREPSLRASMVHRRFALGNSGRARSHDNGDARGSVARASRVDAISDLIRGGHDQSAVAAGVGSQVRRDFGQRPLCLTDVHGVAVNQQIAPLDHAGPSTGHQIVKDLALVLAQGAHDT